MLYQQIQHLINDISSNFDTITNTNATNISTKVQSNIADISMTGMFNKDTYQTILMLRQDN